MLTPADIHERVATHIEHALSNPTIPGPWRQSRIGYDQFPSVDSGDIEHHGFAIGMPRSEPRSEDRQNRPTIWTTTEVRLRWGHRLRADAVVVDTLEALRAEVELVHQVRRTDSNPNLAIDVLDIRRETTRDGLLFLGELGLRFAHLYPL